MTTLLVLLLITQAIVSMILLNYVAYVKGRVGELKKLWEIALRGRWAGSS